METRTVTSFAKSQWLQQKVPPDCPSFLGHRNLNKIESVMC